MNELYIQSFIETNYFIAAILFILGLKKMSSPRGAALGIKWAGLGMLLAVLVTFLYPGLHNSILIISAIAFGTVFAWWTGQKVLMTAMPQMIALFNGMGGGAAAAIAAIELFAASHSQSTQAESFNFLLGMFGALIGSVSFSGSIVAFLKLQELIKKSIYFPLQKFINSLVLILAVILGIYSYFDYSITIFVLFFVFSLSYGVLMTISIGGADMPVVIALYNALTGLAVACEGFVLNNMAMIIAGTVVGASGSLLTHLMAKAMNRSIANVLFARFGGAAKGGGEVVGEPKSLEPSDAAQMLNFVEKIIIVPGYGMAVAQAQQKIWEMTKILIKKGKEVRFAIHPVAGRMPGHMNVLLAEAGVPYDYIFDMDSINSDFAATDAVIVVGANDVVNPAARSNKSSPIYGMPILNVDNAKHIFVIKRGKGKGYAGVENVLFYNDKTRMVYGDAKDVIAKIIENLKESE